MAYTEFCCRSGGSNMNGGAIASNGEPATSPVYSATNGGWNSATGVFTPISGNPSSSVTVGDFAHVFTDGSTTPTFIGLVTAVNSTTVTVSTTAKSGTAPTTAGTGISINVGGAWSGPSAAVPFPFNFVQGTMTNSAGNRLRVNVKNDQTYNITATMAHADSSLKKFQAYGASFGDGGRTTIDGGTTGASYILLQIQNAALVHVEDFIFQNNGATGSASICENNAGGSSASIWRRCTFKGGRGMGYFSTNSASGPNTLVECEAYDNNKSNTSAFGGFKCVAATTFIRCYSHSNAGSSSAGFLLQNGVALDCISESNGGDGFMLYQNGEITRIIGCDAYNNGRDGLRFDTGGGHNSAYVENSNFVKNSGYGINVSAGGVLSGGLIINCGFGSGTQANTLGAINNVTAGDCIEIIGSVTYGTNLTPWNAPTTGDFTITLAAAKGVGRGSFMQSQNSKTGTASTEDIGSAQSAPSGGGGSTGSQRVYVG